ncbi:MAG TPA: phosphoenolpyruvate--protein phosphotransferase [Humibacter sp.]|nr:phosphoenolpyruvate--protein phosphotransferase [Humibacter sp.]
MRISGIGIGRGVAVGVVARMSEPLGEPADVESDADPVEEYRRVERALRATAAELTERAGHADDEGREVLAAQALMAEDPAVIEDIESLIAEGKTAERAVFEAFRTFQRVLEPMGGYMAGRVADLRDVAQRAIARLRGVPMPGVPALDTPFVLVAHDLAPADTAMLDLEKVLAIVTRDGGPTSHTAILARSKGLVAVVGTADSDVLVNGSTVIVDAGAGQVVLDPAEAEIAAARAAGGRVHAVAPSSPGALKDGTRVALLANLGAPDEAADAVSLGAEGVGLLRTEFLYLDARQAPSVDLQRQRYTELLRAFGGKKVVVRVLDAGADKQLRFLGHTPEENPALGRRGIRALREHESVLRDQLSALAQAQNETDADLQVMAPMIADVDETRYFIELGREMGLAKVGITIEVPSCAVLADQVVPLCDFVSIGTNDLTQYTLAADRLLGSVAGYQDPWHPAVLRLVELVGDAGSAAGISVGVCGEAAADPLLAVVFVGLGVTDLSMSPTALAEVRETLAGVTLPEARSRAKAAVHATSAAGARAAAAAVLPRHRSR